jgi:hypothetical protein
LVIQPVPVVPVVVVPDQITLPRLQRELLTRAAGAAAADMSAGLLEALVALVVPVA